MLFLVYAETSDIVLTWFPVIHDNSKDSDRRSLKVHCFQYVQLLMIPYNVLLIVNLMENANITG